jgi:ribosomal protein S18 acetylase RimI-like enzyme
MRDVVDRLWGWDEIWQRTEFQRRLRESLALVIEFDGRSIGGLLLACQETEVYVREIQILPAWQGQGVGTSVLQYIIKHAEGRGAAVALSVVPANPRAQTLYERLGFAVTAVDPPFLRMRRSHSARLRTT